MGAGAAIDIGGCSTKKITEEVSCKNNPHESITNCLLNQVYNILVEKYHPGTNFEDIFYIFEMLHSYQIGWNKETTNREMIPPFSRFVELRNDIFCMNPFLLENPLSDSIKQLIGSIGKLISGYNDNFEKNIKNYSWYKEFWRKGCFDVFNLNYDTTIEFSLDDEYLDGYVKTGKYDRFQPKELFYPNKKYNSSVCHLHGCIRYGYENGDKNDNYGWENLVKYKNYEDAKETWFNRSKHNADSRERTIIGPLITGLRKPDKLYALPYSAYNAYLWKKILENRNLLIVGYSFGDQHVNHLINQMKIIHGDDCRIVVIDYIDPGRVDEDIFGIEQLFGDSGESKSSISDAQCRFLNRILGDRWWNDKSVGNKLAKEFVPSKNNHGMFFVKGFKDAVEKYGTMIFDFFNVD